MTACIAAVMPMAAESHFTRFFQQHRYSDADVSIQLLVACIDDDSVFREEGEELTAFPVHLVVLTQSPYFESQVNFLEQQQECRGRGSSRTETVTGCRSRSRDSVGSKRRRGNEGEQGALARTRRGSNNNNHSNSRPRVVLTVQHREQQAAAVAVIASLYGVTDALSGLQQPELVHAIQYADLLQVGPATAEALHLLQTAAIADAGLPIEILEKLAALPSWPSCLLPLLPDIAKHLSELSNSPNGAISEGRRQSHIQTVLLIVLGDLEAVWQQQELKDLLLKLSLPAMSMLLSSDKLTVYSEDTILYTACKFVAAQQAVSQQVAAIHSLSALIRVGQLSDFQLMLQSTFVPDLPKAGDVLLPHTSNIQRLVSLKRLGLSTTETLAEVQQLLPTAPSSWLSSPRQVIAVPSEGIKLAWDVPVCDVKASVLSCYTMKTLQQISSKASPPLAGLEWRIEAQCKYHEERNCVRIGMYMPASSPCGFKGAFHRFDYTLQVPCNESLGFAGTTAPLKEDEGWGWDCFSGLTMSGGWDEAAWAAAGLPTAGTFAVILRVSKVY